MVGKSCRRKHTGRTFVIIRAVQSVENSGSGGQTTSADFSNGSPSQGTENSTSQPPGNLRFSQTNYAVNENAGNVTITVERTGGDSGTVTVDFATSNGTASQPGDYTATSGTLTFGDGVTSQTFSVTIVDDGDQEGAETVNLTLSNPTAGAGLTNPSTATITINDNESMVKRLSPFPLSSTTSEKPDPGGRASVYVYWVDDNRSNVFKPSFCR